jgi:hypothetical protein
MIFLERGKTMQNILTLLKQVVNRVVYELFDRRAITDAMKEETEALKHQWR